ncbi:protamine P1 family protein [Striga asiatica]|uniref:Protamine P1 family protein n=1 Tax=Striga asiatica TaxID=4170 RepID=A0A5A7R7Q7_STRAF|nr:protamine P1 family protein [Striga asiatica]
MKLSKSFLNPNGRAASFFFLRRRSRSGGPSTADNPEPSSPKVTCIGQVRVKSKRRGRQHRRSLSQRRTGEASFRRAEQLQEERKNQRWVHLPASAMRAFGSEFTCLLFPCCCSHCRITKSGCCCCCCNDGNECWEESGAVLGRCLVCGGGRRREIEAMSGCGDAAASETAAAEESMCVWNCRRQHVFDNIEVRNGRIEVRGRSLEVEDEEGKEERGRVSISIPPKNALLLMRCRSDPTKMAALANRYCNWEHTNHGDIQEEDEDDDYGEAGNLVLEKLPESVCEGEMGVVEQEIQNELKPQLENDFEENVVDNSEEQDHEIRAKDDEEKEEVKSNMSSFEALLDQENLDCNYQENVEETNLATSLAEKDQEEEEKETEETTLEEDEKQEQIETPKDQPLVNSEQLENSKEEHEEEEEEERKQVLPDCLLLMMCEPKLSMEVSKETWVRGADFIRWLPERPRRLARAAAGACEHHQAGGRPPPPPAADPRTKRPVPVPAPPARKSDGHRHQPPRLSCSLPAAAPPMAPCRPGPFALTRCKSEPMSTAAAKLAPEPCVWGDGGGGGVKLEAHGRAAVGGAGVGF